MPVTVMDTRQRHVEEEQQQQLTPLTRRKKVEFSSNLVTADTALVGFVSSGSPGVTTPRSILKTSKLEGLDMSDVSTISPPNSDADDTAVHFDQGNSLSKLLESMLTAFSKKGVAQKLDGYTVLTGKIRTTKEFDDVSKCADALNAVFKFAAQDTQLDVSESSNNLVLYGKAVRLASSLLWHPQICSVLDAKATRALMLKSVNVTCDPKSSKTAVTFHLHLLANQQCPAQWMNGSMVQALLKVLSVPISSTSASQEKLVLLQKCLRLNLSMTMKHVSDWFPFLIGCSLERITLVREKALNVLVMVRRAVTGTSAVGSAIEHCFREGDEKSLLDLVCQRLCEIVQQEHDPVHVSNVWLNMTVLLGGRVLRAWDGLNSWLMVIQHCLNFHSTSAKVAAHVAWKYLIHELGTSIVRDYNETMSAKYYQSTRKLISLMLRPVDVVLSSKNPVHPLVHVSAVNSLKVFLCVFSQFSDVTFSSDIVCDLVVAGTLKSSIKNNSVYKSRCIEIVAEVLQPVEGVHHGSDLESCLDVNETEILVGLPRTNVKCWKVFHEKLATFLSDNIDENATELLPIYRSLCLATEASLKRDVRLSKSSSNLINSADRIMRQAMRTSALPEVLAQYVEARYVDLEGLLANITGILSKAEIDGDIRDNLTAALKVLLRQHSRASGRAWGSALDALLKEPKVDASNQQLLLAAMAWICSSQLFSDDFEMTETAQSLLRDRVTTDDGLAIDNWYDLYCLSVQIQVKSASSLLDLLKGLGKLTSPESVEIEKTRYVFLRAQDSFLGKDDERVSELNYSSAIVLYCRFIYSLANEQMQPQNIEEAEKLIHSRFSKENVARLPILEKELVLVTGSLRLLDSRYDDFGITQQQAILSAFDGIMGLLSRICEERKAAVFEKFSLDDVCSALHIPIEYYDGLPSSGSLAKDLDTWRRRRDEAQQVYDDATKEHVSATLVDSSENNVQAYQEQPLPMQSSETQSTASLGTYGEWLAGRDIVYSTPKRPGASADDESYGETRKPIVKTSHELEGESEVSPTMRRSGRLSGLKRARSYDSAAEVEAAAAEANNTTASQSPSSAPASSNDSILRRGLKRAWSAAEAIRDTGSSFWGSKRARRQSSSDRSDQANEPSGPTNATDALGGSVQSPVDAPSIKQSLSLLTSGLDMMEAVPPYERPARHHIEALQHIAQRMQQQIFRLLS